MIFYTTFTTLKTHCTVYIYIIGAVVFGYLTEKTGAKIEIAKIVFAVACWTGIGICELFREPDMNVPLACLCAL